MIKFGTDGVRGRVNESLLLPDVLAIGTAHGYWLRTRKDEAVRPRVVIGRDSRVSGDALLGAYGAGLMSQGVDLLDLGILPTPAVAVAVRELGADGGCMLSASHNPVPDNGLKLLDHRGEKLVDAQARRLEELAADTAGLDYPMGIGLGRLRDEKGFKERYLQFLAERGEGSLGGLKVVLDCAYGAAVELARRAFQQAGAEVVCLHDEPLGEKINVACGSTDLSALAAAVVEERAHLGLAFDGDADRCLAVAENGELLTGDQMMVLLAEYLSRSGRLAQNLVVFTVMSNLGAERTLQSLGIETLRTAVGDRYVFEAMRQRGAILGGEQSGHILLLDRHWSGDGILAGLVFAGVVKQAGQPVSRLLEAIPELPQKLVNVVGVDREKLAGNAKVAEAVSRAEQRLGERGRILVRPSGTEPMVRLMAEGVELTEIEQVLADLKEVVLAELS